VTRNQLYLQTMEAIYSRTNKVIIDGKGGANSLLYLPLDKLLAGATANAPASAVGGNALPGSAGPASVAPTPESTGGATRAADDELRSRDREDR
jgi:membrane protease subunit HflK